MSENIRIPEIIKETSSGYMRVTLQEEMFKRREIECVGDITADRINSLILQLRYLQKEDPEKAITIYISSPGGEVSSGLALYDVMKAIHCPIRTVCVGTAASMAAILFLSGDQRDMLPHARVMLHDPLIQQQAGGSALQIDRLGKELMKTREIIGNIIAEHTGRSLKEVYKKTATDSYFDAKESIAWGLADRIITELNETEKMEQTKDVS
ncbi:MAG: ATP-dependent Clp protease proteolytic subunit [Ruminococcus sp.]|nr:ATP-dependent Clp protease proteolytic subunit [Ruminococcus sp.]